jgi:hypothetical protein
MNDAIKYVLCFVTGYVIGQVSVLVYLYMKGQHNESTRSDNNS